MKPETLLFSVKKTGATGDGKILDTIPIQKTINNCAESGGGTVIVPPGEYLTGALELLSNVELHLLPGAKVKGSSNIDDYYLNGELAGLITAKYAKNITISGRGVIDGSGTSFIDVTESKKSGKYDPDAHQQTEPAVSGIKPNDGPAVMLTRPGCMLNFCGCENVIIQDITVIDAPFWTILINGSNNVKIFNTSIQNPCIVPNDDGIHCTSSSDVIISGCNILSGDDSIAITGINDECHMNILPGFIRHTRTTENIIVSNCILRSRSGSVRVGYGHNDIRNCIFQNLIIETTNRGLGIFVRDAGSIQNIQFSNITMKTELHNETWWGNGEPIHISSINQFVGKPLGSIQNIRFSNITAEAANGVLIYGTEKSIIKNVELNNIRLEIKSDPRNKSRGGKFDIRPAYKEELGFFSHDIPGVFCQHTDGLKIKEFELNWAENVPDFFTHGLTCEFVNNIEIDNSFPKSAPNSNKNEAVKLLESNFRAKLQKT